jgi:NAD(P)-dependent dehydrogenase (short-subunit alcohol dehydrogenase family)
MEQFSGRTAVITGAGSGMGKAFALRLAAEGMRVVAADIQDDALAATVTELEGSGTEAIGVHTDVSDAAAVHALAKAANETFGAVHVLCNNAGVEGYLDGAIWEATDKDWQWTFDVNFWSVVNGIRAFVPGMISHGEGAHVVNTASMTSVIAAGNMYGITKHAVLALSEVLASDLRKRDAPVGVTAICPGTIATNLFRGSRNRPDALRNEVPTPGADDGAELRERMHAVLSEGMAPAEVADKVVDAIRRNAQYLLTDRDWNPQIIRRHEALLAAAVDRVASS